MDMGEVFSSSWKVFWKYKLLWLFGIIPPLIYAIPAGVMMFFTLDPRFISDKGNPFLSYGLLIFDFVYLFLMLVYMFLYVLAETSIVKGTLSFDQKGERPAAGDLIRQSLPFYWRALGLFAIFVGAYFVIAIIFFAIVAVAAVVTLGAGLLCVFPLILLALPFGVLAVAFLHLAWNSIVHDNIGIGECLRRGRALFKARFWKIVLLAVILYFGMIVITMIFSIPLYAAMFIPLFSNLGQATTNPEAFGTQFISSMRWTYVIFIPVISLVSGILNTFMGQAWVIAYLRLSSRPAEATLPPVAPVEPVVGNP